jgi:hypothetical protein
MVKEFQKAGAEDEDSEQIGNLTEWQVGFHPLEKRSDVVQFVAAHMEFYRLLAKVIEDVSETDLGEQTKLQTFVTRFIALMHHNPSMNRDRDSEMESVIGKRILLTFESTSDSGDHTIDFYDDEDSIICSLHFKVNFITDKRQWSCKNKDDERIEADKFFKILKPYIQKMQIKQFYFRWQKRLIGRLEALVSPQPH